MASVVFFTMCLLSLDYVLSTQTTKLLSRYKTETTTSQAHVASFPLLAYVVDTRPRSQAMEEETTAWYPLLVRA